MTKEIFRRAALDRLASPEQLDRPVRIVSAIGWIALIGFIAAVSTGLTWAFTARAPVKVLAQGILIEEGGLFEIVASKQGRLKELHLAQGWEVDANEVVATLAQTDLERELATAEANHSDAAARYERLKIFYKEVTVRQGKAENERLETMGQTTKQVLRRLELLKEKAAALEKLIKQKVIVKDKRIDIQLKISNAQERLSTLDDEKKIIALKILDRTSKRRLALLDEQLKVKEHERRVARLKDNLAEKQIIRSPHSGIVMEVKVDLGDVVAPGRALATIAPKAKSNNSTLKAILYVSPKDGKLVKAGMTVELIPSTVRPEKFGYMLGEVERVAPLPATVEGMKIVLKNEQLARQLSGEGAPFEVRVRPLKDIATISGYKWSSSKGPPIKINAGTLVEGKLIVNRIRLIGLVAPGLDRTDDGLDR